MQKQFTNYFGTPLIIGIRTKLYSNEILFFEGDVNYARVHFKSGKQRMIARTLLYIQNKINTENFIRISRKHLVNRKFIEEVNQDHVVLVDKTVLPFSRRRRREFWVVGG
jgi:DNA-binding LytR/AlgR family response regulator